MIPGVLRGVIASSWLRASDDLRAPNAITTGQVLPEPAPWVSNYPAWRNEARMRMIALLTPPRLMVSHHFQAVIILRKTS